MEVQITELVSMGYTVLFEQAPTANSLIVQREGHMYQEFWANHTHLREAVRLIYTRIKEPDLL